MKAFHRILVLFLAAFLASLSAGTKLISRDSQNNQGIIVGPDDTVSIVALDADEISKSWRVASSGELNLPMLGKIQAAGLTVDQLEQEIANRMKRFYRDPQVTVFVSEFRSQPVSVIGAVDKPGTYQLQGAKTLFQALLLSGGPKPEAGITLTLKRNSERGDIPYPGAKSVEDGEYHVLELDLKEVMQGQSEAAMVPVQPFDVISVSDIRQPKLVHIAGEVNKPGAVELISQDTVSLMQVLAVAGGLTRTSSPGKTMIMHLNAQGVQTSLGFVDLKKIMNGKAKDLDLSAGDIIIVPSNTIMSYVQAASTSAITTGIYILGRF